MAKVARDSFKPDVTSRVPELREVLAAKHDGVSGIAHPT
jgi:hypothetical protein